MKSLGTLGEQLIATRSSDYEKLRLAFIQYDPQVLLDVMDQVGAEGIASFLGEQRLVYLSAGLQKVMLENDAFLMDMVRHGLPLDARIYSSGWDPRTALGLSLEAGNFSYASELLGLGADPDDCGKASSHPLNVACSLRSQESALALVQILLDKGANPNGYDTHHTPLFCLAEQGWIEPALLLLQRGAHGAMSTITDRTVVEMARMKSNNAWADTVEAVLAARVLDAATPSQNKTGERIRL
jgi:hypothetical protein